MSTQGSMDVRAIRPYWLLPLLLCHPAAGAVTHNVTNVTFGHTPLSYWGLWRQPPMAAMTAWQPPLVLPLPALALPQTRFLFFEYLTKEGQYIPGLAKDSQCCGRENIATKIVGGSVTSPNQYPWMAFLFVMGAPATYCGGTLLNDRYVLTTAECVSGVMAASILVNLGEHELGNTMDSLSIAGQQVIAHPEYDATTLDNNIALVKLVQVLQLPIMGNMIAPICMPHRSKYTYRAAVAAGWGQIDTMGTPATFLRAISLRTISNSRCENELDLILPRFLICADSDDESNKFPCLQDDGGPLFTKTWFNTRYTLIGVTSRFDNFCQPGASIYTRVYPYLDWMIDNMPDAIYC